jgi:hypothetical protein
VRLYSPGAAIGASGAGVWQSLKAMWHGQERRSETSAAARAAVTAREQAEAIESELGRLGSRRFGNRGRIAELERELRDIRTVERRCLEALGANLESRAS